MWDTEAIARVMKYSGMSRAHQALVLDKGETLRQIVMECERLTDEASEEGEMQRHFWPRVSAMLGRPAGHNLLEGRTVEDEIDRLIECVVLDAAGWDDPMEPDHLAHYIATGEF